MTETDKPDLAGLYRDTRERLSDLIAGLGAAALSTMVPGCPLWAVRDVLAHLTAITEDALAGRLPVPPDEEFTAGQVARFAHVPVPEMLDRWSASGPQFEDVVQAFDVWPAVIDVASHEQDIRGALGQPGARDCAAIRQTTPVLAAGLDVPVRIVTERREYSVGGGPVGGGPVGGGPVGGGPPTLTVSTSEFEMFRWRMGRRSLAQLAAMDWSGDPSAILGKLTVFGPTASDIVE